MFISWLYILTEDNTIWTNRGYIGHHVHMDANMDKIAFLELMIYN